jgi:hypothetical protein
MRKLFVLITFSFLLISGTVFGADLVGTWELETDCLEIGNNNVPDDPGVISHDSETLVIVWQQQGLYKGYLCNDPTPNGTLFGTIINNNVTLTQWDAHVEGKLQGKNKINLVSQHVLYNPPAAPGTCIGTLTRLSVDSICP